MFLIFKDSSLGETRLALNSISFYYSRGDSVVVTVNTGVTLRSKEHTLEEIDLAVTEGYHHIKPIPVKK
jgi:hypothetical protein